MNAKEIADFVRRNIEPLPALHPYGERYRVSGILRDGTALPCIVVESASKRIDLALRRFKETKPPVESRESYLAVVRNFVAVGNRLNDYDLRELSISPHAIPLARLREINGETTMGWTEFTAIMSDGRPFLFGTRFLTEFFDMPQGYSAQNISRIIPAVEGKPSGEQPIYREKPFFTCYIDCLGP
jgi:hypothetical protein